ncbi:MAG: putative monovalent cation/H+ antiporter subunit A [Anaerolineae bacterium]|nr:putative monovalent cation/H+ antiporter subunit A [Anaerolineae bacterium]
MITAVLSGFVLALFVPIIQRVSRTATGWVLSLLPLSLLIYFISFIGPLPAGGQAITYAWIPAMSINLSFYVDGLSLLFAMIITGVGTLVVIYGGGYLAGHAQIGRFYTFVLMFMASMLGVVLSNNLLTLFVFWELTSITSYMLIGYYHEKAESRFAALQAMLVTGGGGLAMLAGLIMLGVIGQSWEISELVSQAEVIRNHELYLPILILILAGAFTKSAQFPFHFWLPGAMAAPAPVSAYLHSATMVKAGVYLVARMSPVLGHTDSWLTIVSGFGAVTMLLTAYIAWQQTDLKRILAYSTVSALGTLMLLLGLGDHLAVEAAIVFLVVHSLYKGTLFMVAGTVDHETGTRFITELGGLWKAMPILGATAILAAFSMSGFPPFLGFVGKELIYEGTQEAHLLPLMITAAAVLANILTIIAAFLVFYRPFFGPQVETPKHAHEAPWSMLLGPVVLSGLGLLIGLLVAQFGEVIVGPAVSSILAEPTEVHLHLIPTQFSPTVMLSLITIAGVIGLYFVRDPLARLVQPLNAVTAIGPERWYQWSLDGMMAVARWQTRILQSGFLRYYLMIVILTTVALTGYSLITLGVLAETNILRSPRDLIYEDLIYLIIVAATLVVVRTESRLTAVAALGVIGYAIALIFILFGAPDLAMTQFSIETLSVILLVLVLYKLPRFINFSSVPEKTRDWLIAASGGGLMTLLVLIVTALPGDSRLTPYFAENSYLLAKGHNVVNVILVDFRGFDTMGEITVLGIAAIGVFGLLKLRLDKRDQANSGDSE